MRLSSLQSVPQLKTHDRCERFTGGRWRQLGNFPASFADRIVYDGVSRALHDREFFYRTVPFDFQLHGCRELCSKAHFTSRLVPSCVEPATDDLRISRQSIVARSFTFAVPSTGARLAFGVRRPNFAKATLDRLAFGAANISGPFGV